MDPSRLIPGDATLIENIVNYLKAKGIFDEFRHECLADVDTKSSFQNLNQRVDGYTSKFLATETWNPDLNKNELRNKLRRHIDESGMLAVGADHVVEQVINPKIHPFFLPKIIEVVHQFLREQSELFSKKTEVCNDSSAAEKSVTDVSDGSASKTKTTVSDPIADILSFSYSKTKPSTAGSAHGKAESAQQKHVDLKKKKEEEIIAEKKKREEESAAEKKKREEESAAEKKIVPESAELSTEDQITCIISETKLQGDKEKVKKEIRAEESESNQESSKKPVKEEMKLEKKKTDDAKTQNNEIPITSDENKTNLSSSAAKRPFSRPKSRPKDSSSTKDSKKHKKESSDKSVEKHLKHKPSKSAKEITSPTKSTNVSKMNTKEKVSSDDSSGKKSLEKKSFKLDNSLKESKELKRKNHSEKSERTKVSKKEWILNEPGSIEKGTKNNQYSSSYDSSQGSDQEKNSSDSKVEKKHFSKHAQKESSEKQSDRVSKTLPDKKHSKDSDEGSLKKQKREKSSKLEQTKIVGEAAKISSRSNSFGSSSSIGSSSNTSKDNLASNSDDISESSSKDKKKRAKEKEPCQASKTLPPPPPPPPPSGTVSAELSSSAEMSSMEDTQSSSNSEKSSSAESTEVSSSDSESESPLAILEALEKYAPSTSVNDINDFYDIFLYSSSSEDFEGYGTSPEKIKTVKNEFNSDISCSSVHTSDLSSFDDELSDDGVLNGPGVKKRLTLKEAQQLIQNRALLQQYKNKIQSAENKFKEDHSDAPLNCEEKPSALSSEDESSPSEPIRSLRRERKLNPRYASSEYTSIFNCKKESFITKQTSPVKKIQSPISSPSVELKHRRRESVIEKQRPTKIASKQEICFEEMVIETASKKHAGNEEIPPLENSKKSKVKKASVNEKTNVQNNSERNHELKATKVPKDSEDKATINSIEIKEIESQENSNEIDVAIKYSEEKSRPHGIKGIILYSESLDHEREEQLSSSDEMNSILDKDLLYRENNDKTDILSVSDHLKVQFQFKPQNNSKLSIHSHPVKRKLQMEEGSAAKRPCSRSSIDSSSSESATNENKPFNISKQNSLEEKILRDHNELKATDLADKIKNDLFCKRNNNGDILGQKEILLNSHGKTVNISERKTKESDSSKELNSL